MCEFCSGETDLLDSRELSLNNEGYYTGFELWIEDSTLCAYACLDNAKVHPVSGHTEMKIRFCPMCGRNIGC